MSGFHSKQQMAADKLQEPINLLEARKIAAEYGTPNSQIDSGNLYFALSKCLEHIDAQPAQEQRPWVGLTNDEVNDFAAGCHLGQSVQGAIYEAEAKLKEKNNGT